MKAVSHHYGQTLYTDIYYTSLLFYSFNEYICLWKMKFDKKVKSFILFEKKRA